ncbi:hypothetical protein FACS189494_03340 [Spirochaetia bacterium]|nr:hypothetical protein FACS189494_03340 [Spirochaetia bacterium]
MKKIIFLLALALFSCVTNQPLRFLPIVDLYIANVVDIININDFEELAYKSPTKNVYYNDEYFFVQIDSVFYSHISRGYKSFKEYREGRLKEPDEWAVFKPGYSD